MPVADHFMAAPFNADPVIPKLKGRNVCEKCCKTFEDKTNLWRHVQQEHGNDSDLLCSEPNCGKLFASNALKIAHIAHHETNGVLTNTCEMCGMLLASRKTFYRHVTIVHKDSIKDLCGFCLKFSQNTTALKVHVWQTHTRQMLTGIRCDVCGKGYCNTKMMLKHKAIHKIKGNYCSIIPINTKNNVSS
ncbi:oocyte zinc finger protein XlCOF7.1-like [Daktulosphaira vitifoliae]|uniref:oocyte zinc finger protein XlCOF7.1-like n=1 Tax=Daktulosphaira vitifoliae TaxID=58002 RepID=UPI0021AAD95B|nr:oocyte zinc finger protein XlCOF7.1-like [Daktulosphaira vitifoliae]